MVADDIPKRIIVVSQSETLVDVITLFLESWFLSKIEILDSTRKVIDFFEESSTRRVDLVIVDDQKLLSGAEKSIADFMAPSIVVGKKQEQKPVTGRKMVFLQSPLKLDELAETIQNFAEAGGHKLREYCPVRVEIFILIGKELAQDTYRIKKDGTFERSFKKGERIDSNEEEFIRAAKEKFLFLKIEDFSPFMKEFVQGLQKASAGSEKVFDIAASINLSTNVHELLSQALPELGFTPELRQATKATMDVVVNSLQKDTKLSDLLDSLAKNESDYLCWHSVTICFLAARLSSLMTWNSKSTQFKLSLASFLHDITLKDSPLQRVTSKTELEAAKATDAEKAAFLEHSHQAAALARTMKDFPGDVDHIIAQHHELPDGKGFPLGVNHTRISPLTALFVISHDMADELFDNRANFNLKKSVARLEQKYQSGYFKQIIAALRDLCTKEAASL